MTPSRAGTIRPTSPLHRARRRRVPVVSARVLWFLGFPDRALATVEAGLALADRLAHPYSLAFALTWAAMLHAVRREFEACAETGRRGDRPRARAPHAVVARAGDDVPRLRPGRARPLRRGDRRLSEPASPTGTANGAALHGYPWWHGLHGGSPFGSAGSTTRSPRWTGDRRPPPRPGNATISGAVPAARDRPGGDRRRRRRGDWLRQAIEPPRASRQRSLGAGAAANLARLWRDQGRRARRTTSSRRSTAGSPKASTRPTSPRPRRC